MRSNRMNRSRAEALVGPLVLAAVLAWPTPARAHDTGTFSTIVALGLGGIGSGALVVGGAVTGVHNGVVAGQGGQLTKGWNDAGNVIGALNVVGCLAWLTVGVTAAVDGSPTLRDLGLSFAVVQGVVGGVGLGMTSWGAPKEGPRVMLVPAPMRDVSGYVVPGIGVTGVGF